MVSNIDSLYRVIPACFWAQHLLKKQHTDFCTGYSFKWITLYKSFRKLNFTVIRSRAKYVVATFLKYWQVLPVKVKLSFACHDGVLEELRYATVPLILNLDTGLQVSGELYTTAALTSGKDRSTHGMEDWVRRRTCLGVSKRSKPLVPTGNQSVAPAGNWTLLTIQTTPCD